MPALKNPKHEAVALQKASGTPQLEIAQNLGLTEGYVSKLCKKVQVLDRIGEIQADIAEKATWDAARVLQRLGEQADADLCEIQDHEGRFKPLSQWPLHWRRMIQGIEYEEKAVRSTDGVQAGESKAWDKTGDRILKIKFVDRLKNLELLGRHKAVDAFVQQKSEDHVHLHLHAELNQRIAAGRQRARERVREITATSAS
jgi:phage terminase small subunit